MNETNAPDELISRLLAATTRGLTPDEVEEINLLLARYPVDTRSQYLGYIVKLNHGDQCGALDSLWTCLEISPKEKVFMESIQDLLAPSNTDSSTTSGYSGSNNSPVGEYENKPEYLVGIASRYKYVARTLLQNCSTTSSLCGLDLSSKDGSFTRLIHNLTGARMIGICANQDGVQNANNSYGNHRVAFLHQKSPFILRKDIYNFAICFGALEYVSNHELFIENIFEANIKTIFIAVPAGENLARTKHKTRLKDNQFHFSSSELIDICEKNGAYSVKRASSQLFYEPDDAGVLTLVGSNRMYVRPTFPHADFHLVHLEKRLA